MLKSKNNGKLYFVHLWFARKHFAYQWFKNWHFTHLKLVLFVFRYLPLLKIRINFYFCYIFMSLSSQNIKN